MSIKVKIKKEKKTFDGNVKLQHYHCLHRKNHWRNAVQVHYRQNKYIK